LAEKETRLGKGLGALLGEYLDEEHESGERQVPVDQVRPNPYQPRTDFEEDALAELVESIRANGLLQPLVVRPTEEGWEVVAGERRLRALRKLGWSTAPVVVRELSDQQMLVLALVENLQRENLSPIEEGQGYRSLMEAFDLTQSQVADRVGKDRSTVANTLRLLHLDDEVKRMVSSGALSAGHGRAILGLDGSEAQVELAREVVEKDLSVRATERRVRTLKEGDGQEDDGGSGTSTRQKDPVARKAERLLERALGTQVSVGLSGSDRGEIKVVFHDAEEFERIVGLLIGQEAGELFDG
jgi:ParB family chromosome partitioning protein